MSSSPSSKTSFHWWHIGSAPGSLLYLRNTCSFTSCLGNHLIGQVMRTRVGYLLDSQRCYHFLLVSLEPLWACIRFGIRVLLRYKLEVLELTLGHGSLSALRVFCFHPWDGWSWENSGASLTFQDLELTLNHSCFRLWNIGANKFWFFFCWFKWSLVILILKKLLWPLFDVAVSLQGSWERAVVSVAWPTH